MEKIPLRNRKGEIVDYTIVSSEHYQHLNQFKWHKNGKYVQGIVYKKPWKIHRYIKSVILKEIIPKGHVVDHIDNDLLNNHQDNLRIVTRGQNSNNRKKKINCSSGFIGVTKNNKKKFVASLKLKGKIISARYYNEIHAAKARDIVTIKYFGNNNLNFTDTI